MGRAAALKGGQKFLSFRSLRHSRSRLPSFFLLPTPLSLSLRPLLRLPGSYIGPVVRATGWP